MHHSSVEAWVYGHGSGGGENVAFNCNHHGDFCGDVIISAPIGSFHFEQSAPVKMDTYSVPGYDKIRIPFEVMEALVAENARKKRIAAAEDASDEDLLYGGAQD